MKGEGREGRERLRATQEGHQPRTHSWAGAFPGGADVTGEREATSYLWVGTGYAQGSRNLTQLRSQSLPLGFGVGLTIPDRDPVLTESQIWEHGSRRCFVAPNRTRTLFCG